MHRHLDSTQLASAFARTRRRIPVRWHSKLADDQHPDHQFRIDRWPANSTVERRQFLPQPVEFDKPVDRAQEVPLWHMIFARELVKQSVLPEVAFPHRPLHPGPNDRSEAAAPTRRPPDFFNGIALEKTFRR